MGMFSYSFTILVVITDVVQGAYIHIGVRLPLLVSTNRAMREPNTVERATGVGFTLFIYIWFRSKLTDKECVMQDRKETEVRDVLGFFKWVKETFFIDYQVGGETWRWLQDKVYYRGHSKRTWELIPSIFRKEESRPTWLDECNILDRASQVLWMSEM